MKMKTCFKCGETIPIGEFYEHPKMADGHLNKCKQCTRNDTLENRRKNKDYYLEYDKNRAMLPHRVKQRKEYSKTEKGKEVQAISTRKYKLKNPEKYKAHLRVCAAKASGRLEVKSACEVCGCESKLQAHHEDYLKPLEVIWLCSKCHSDRHKEIMKGNCYQRMA
jgi:hypothetical protein